MPPSAIAPAEAALQQAANKEETNVNRQVEKLVATLDKLQTAGSKAKLAHAGLAQAGLVIAETDPARQAAAASIVTALAGLLHMMFLRKAHDAMGVDKKATVYEIMY